MTQSSPPIPLELCQRATRIFELLGKRWSGLVVDLLLQRPARFSELARTVPGLSERVLGERLRELEEAGVVERTVDPGPPITVTYALTQLGAGLEPAMAELRTWASKLMDHDVRVSKPSGPAGTRT
jgi:DNA-binding HxlR family transcriptional regulator